MTKKNLIVGQSGGPTAVINSSLYGVVSEGIAHSDEIGEVYGMVNGIEGFLEDRILNFREALPGEQLDYLKHTPGAYLGSAVTNCRNLWKIRFTLFFSKNSGNEYRLVLLYRGQ